MTSKYLYHEDGALPVQGEIFVFGSNIAGIHGAGAAKVAKEKFKAKVGHGFGWVSKSAFAIPTKDDKIKSLTIALISKHVEWFKEIVAKHPDEIFWVTRVGCGLAGYTDDDIAPLFVGSPSNCNFAIEWKPYLENGNG
jgi:hypothetical protein